MTPQVPNNGQNENPTKATVTMTPPTEYDRFRDLASKLVKVPKKELDEARERERTTKP